MYYGKLLRHIAEALRELPREIQGGIDKISSKIDAAAARYNNVTPMPTIVGTLHRPQAEIDQEEAREARKEIRDSRAEGRERRRLWIESIGLLLTAILVIANIGVLIFYALQLKQMEIATRETARSGDIAASALRENQRQFQIASASNERQFQDTLNQMRSQTGAQNAAVQAARDAIRATQDQMRLEQRAWISVTDFQTIGGVVTEGSETSSGLFHFDGPRFTARNSGRTPAINVAFSELSFCRRFGEDKIGDYDSEIAALEKQKREANNKRIEDLIRAQPDIPPDKIRRDAEQMQKEWDSKATTEAQIVAPDVSVPLTLYGGGCPDRDNSQWPKNWPVTTVVLGKISYNDIFNGTPIRFTEFCLERTKGNTLTLCPNGQRMK
jgi:hypothetical protein